MSVNGITTSSQAYSSAAVSTASNTTTAKKSEETKEIKKDTAAVYEKSSKSTSTDYKTDTSTIAQLKADADKHTAQLRSLVEKLILKQGNSYNIANDNDMYNLLRQGKVQVDAQTAEQAKKDIADDGYWGVTQTSDRIVSFAKALAGNDPEKADEMIKAFQKGFKAATKAWGGELPGICGQTYDATMEKLNAWKDGTEKSAAVENDQ